VNAAETRTNAHCYDFRGEARGNPQASTDFRLWGILSLFQAFSLFFAMVVREGNVITTK
jgi:hypothetical protein